MLLYSYAGHTGSRFALSGWPTVERRLQPGCTTEAASRKREPLRVSLDLRTEVDQGA